MPNYPPKAAQRTTVNKFNLKQQPIPVVPRPMVIVNADGTVSRSGQLLLEQLQDTSGTDLEEATFVLNSTAVAANVTNLLPVQRGGACVAAEIVPKSAVSATFTCDILLTPAGKSFASYRNSIFQPNNKITAPAGTAAGKVITQTKFAKTPYNLHPNDVLSMDILASDGTGVYTIVLRWTPVQ